MNKEKINNEEMFECKMYITDLETNKDSKEINIQDLVFDDYVEFEFGDYEDEDYSQLPYKDFKFFINDYSVTFYSPQYHKAIKEIDRLNNVINELEKELNKDYETYICKNKSYGKTFKAGANIYREHILHKLKELKENRDEG